MVTEGTSQGQPEYSLYRASTVALGQHFQMDSETSPNVALLYLLGDLAFLGPFSNRNKVVTMLHLNDL